MCNNPGEMSNGANWSRVDPELELTCNTVESVTWGGLTRTGWPVSRVWGAKRGQNMQHRKSLSGRQMKLFRSSEPLVVPLVLDTWNTLMPYLAKLAELYDLIGA